MPGGQWGGQPLPGVGRGGYVGDRQAWCAGGGAQAEAVLSVGEGLRKLKVCSPGGVNCCGKGRGPLTSRWRPHRW